MVARFVMKFKKQRIISIIAILTMAIVLSFVFVACNKTDGKDPGDKDLIEPPKKELSASEIYRQVNPSVAFVLIENLSGYSSGSGFFIDSNGTLITNYHVIDDGLSGAIQLYDGTVATIDSVIGYDKNLDIAILSTSAKNTSPVKIADSIIQVGETVYAIGYPEAFKLGFSSSTFTSGMVSMNRSIEGYSYIQSTVNITHGNSGGALINKYGEVVGITTSGITYANIDYMNLSIPIQRIDTVSRTANEPLVIVTRRKYPVYATFYSDGAKYTTQTLSYEGRASVPTTPVKAGYTLDGWYTDSSFTEKFDFNKKITSDVSIYAKWSVATYTIDYNLNSGSWNGSSPSTTYTLNDCGYALPVPTREGYIFEGWKNLSGNFISNYPDVNHLRNLSLYASWIEGTEGLVFSTYYTNYVSVTGYNGNADNVVIPKTYKGLPVKIIEDSAFNCQTRLKSVTIPNSVTSIGSSTFSGCTGLTSITIPDRVTSIGERAFRGCTGLTSITIPNNVTSIGNSAFYGCTGLTCVTIGNSVTRIGSDAFYGCTNLFEVFNHSSLSLTIGASNYGYIAYYANVVYKYENGGYISTDKDGFVITVVNNTKTLTAYSGDSSTVNIPYGVQTINNNVFKDNTNIKSIDIPDSVTSIGSSAFSRCTGLTSVTIPNSVTSIGRSAFYNCTGLTSVTIGSGLKSIGEDAFRGCSGLTSVTIPDSVTSIDNEAFSGCTGLTSVTIGNGVTYISSKSFYDCTGLTSVTIPDSVTSIGWYAFAGCTGLTSVTIPGSVTSIGYEAFNGCTGLTSVTIGNGVTSIGNVAFQNCSGLTSITIPNSVTSIGYQAFSGCTGLTSVTIGSGVTSIGYQAFSSCKGLTGITIPDSVTSIGTSAFSGCSGLTSITIPDSVTSIGGSAFYDTAWYNNQPNGLVYAGKVAYEYKGTMPSNTSIVLKEGTLGIGSSAFYKCTGLTSITIPNSVTSIGSSAFSSCTGLTSITIPNSVTSIGSSAFSSCTGLTSITIPDSVTGIDNGAFSWCTGLTSVTIGNGVTRISSSAFMGCTGLVNISVAVDNTKYHSSGNCLIETASKTLILGFNTSVIPSDGSVTSIGEDAFRGCSGLTSITIPNSVTSIGNSAFSGCTGLTSITIPNSVTSIGDSAFQGCTGLTSITIPNSVTSIGSSTFSGCTGLTSVTIGNSVTSIDWCAFYCCTRLTNIKFNGTIAQWKAISKGGNWKYNVPSTCKVICTDGTIFI